MYVLNGVSNQLMRLTISDPLVYPIVRFTFLRFEIHLLYIEFFLILIHVYNKNIFSGINFNKTTNVNKPRVPENS
jgi:hypothetical protein